MTTKFEMVCEEFSAFFIARKGKILAIEQNYWKSYTLDIQHVLKDYIGKPFFTLFRLDFVKDLRLTPLENMKETRMSVTTEAAALLAQIDANMGNIKPDLDKAEESVGGRTLPLGHQSAVVQITSAILKPSKNGPPNINIQSEVVEDIEDKGTTNFAGIKLGWNYWFGRSTTKPFSEIDPFGKGMMVPKKDGTGERYLRSTLEEFYGWCKRAGFGAEVLEGIAQGKMTIPFTAVVNAIDKGLFIVINNGRSVYNGEVDKYVVKPTEPNYTPPEQTLFEPQDSEPVKVAKSLSQFEKGDRVTSMNNYFQDGEAYLGHYISDNGNDATVKWDDEETSNIPLKDLRILDNGQPDNEETKVTTEESQVQEPFVEGQIIQSNSNFEHGAGWEGTVKEFSKDIIVIDWEDGTTDRIPHNQVDVE